jgi:hypothetical protein
MWCRRLLPRRTWGAVWWRRLPLAPGSAPPPAQACPLRRPRACRPWACATARRQALSGRSAGQGAGGLQRSGPPPGAAQRGAAHLGARFLGAGLGAGAGAAGAGRPGSRSIGWSMAAGRAQPAARSSQQPAPALLLTPRSTAPFSHARQRGTWWPSATTATAASAAALELQALGAAQHAAGVDEHARAARPRENRWRRLLRWPAAPPSGHLAAASPGHTWGTPSAPTASDPAQKGPCALGVRWRAALAGAAVGRGVAGGRWVTGRLPVLCRLPGARR